MLRPALRTLLPYVIGIIIASYLDLPLFASLASTAILIMAATVAFAKRRSQIANFVLIFALIMLGFFRYHFVTRPTIPPTFFDQNIHFAGHVTYHPESSDLFVSGQINLLVDETHKKIKGNFIVTPNSVKLRYGDLIEFNGVLRQPSGKRNPGGFDYRSYLMQKGVRGIIDPWQSAKLTPKGHDGSFWIVQIDRLREKVEGVIDQCMFQHSQIVQAIILGRRQDLSDDVIQAFRNSGVFHVLAVSGLHVGLVSAACFALLSLFRIPQKIICGITIALVVIYAGLVGPRTSVIRASLIIGLYLFARIIDRDSDILNLLGISALVILMINPMMLWNVGFQLTFVATAAIVYLIPKWESISFTSFRKFSKLRNFYHSWPGKIILIPFIVTVSAQIATQPLIARYFNHIYLIALLSNVPVALLIWYIASVSFATIIGGLIWMPIGELFGNANFPAIELLLKTVKFFSTEPLRVNTPKFLFFVVYIAVFFAVVNWRWVWREKRKTIGIACLIFLICIIYWAFQPSSELLEVTFLDVGQGDSAFVHLPNGKNLLIDGGMLTENYDAGERVVEPFLRYHGVGKIDAVILTHSHNDHIGGLFRVLRNFKVEQFIARDHTNQADQSYDDLCKIANQKKIIHNKNPNDLFTNSDFLQIQFMPNLKIQSNDPETDVNDNSIVLKIRYGEITILFTGDIEKEAEKKLVGLGIALEADILKAPHHGSDTSSTDEFVEAVNPKYVVFPVGVRNRFGFPSKIVSERYHKLGAKIYRTDQSGAITFYSDGEKVWGK